MSESLHVIAIPNDRAKCYSSQIEITRYENYIEIKQDNYILGSIRLVSDNIINPDFEHVPQVSITVTYPVRKKE